MADSADDLSPPSAETGRRRAPDRSRSRRERVLVAIGLLAAVLLGDLLFYPPTQEDAYITFRYSEHLAEGYGVGAWNTTGARVEGYTPALWMFWLAIAPPLGIAIPTWAKLWGSVAQLALCGFLLAYPSWRRPERAEPDALLAADADVYTFAAVSLGLYLPFAWYASSGMEAAVFALLVTLAWLLPICVESGLAIFAVYGALVAMRPEGALVGGVFALWHGARSWRMGGGLGAGAPALAAVIAMCIALTVFRLAVFGEWVPNTYFAKVAGGGELLWRLGAIYLAEWGEHHIAWCAALLVAMLGGCLTLRRRGFDVWGGTAVAFGLVAVFALYVWRVGGDNPTAFPYWRHGLHVTPVLLVLVGLGAASITRRASLRFVLLALCVLSTHVSVMGAHHGRLEEELAAARTRFPSLRHVAPNAYYLWIAELAAPDTVIASPAAGELPYIVDAVHIDMLGLNDRYIAHHGHFDPDGPVDSKSDISSVLDREPDLIQSTLHTVRFTKGSPRGGRILHRGAMEAALLNDPRFQSEYLFVENAPYEARDRALFMRRSFWNAHPERERLRVVPVRRTAIYGGGRAAFRETNHVKP